MINILEVETKQFLMFVLLGIIFSIIFDFFRAIRKVKKIKTFTVYFQDIIYFIIIGTILVIVIIQYLQESFRIYLLFSIVLGVFIYIGLIGNKVLMLFEKIIRLNNKIFEFIFLPFEVPKTIFSKQICFLNKFVKSCCKKISNMVHFKYTKKKFAKIDIRKLNKRGSINDKKGYKDI